MTDEFNERFKNLTLTFGGFCTNKISETKTIQSLIEAFCKEAKCNEIKYQKDFHYEFPYKILTENGNKIDINIIFIEINLTKKIKISSTIDRYIVFFDLENDNSLTELENILKYLNVVNLNDKKIYLINFFKNKKNKKTILTDEKIKAYFEKYRLNNYDISDIDLTKSYVDLKNVIDSILLEALEEKMINDEDNNNQNLPEDDKSNSKCFIF